MASFALAPKADTTDTYLYREETQRKRCCCSCVYPSALLRMITSLFTCVQKDESTFLPEKTTVHEWKAESQGLYLLIPGLGASPYVWREYVSTLKKSHPEADCIAATVLDNGNCSLSKAAAPIKALVQSYLKAHPKRPICLIGESNGGRIIGDVESSLREGGTNFKVISLAGAFFGKRLMRYIPDCCSPFDRSVHRELSFSSGRGKELVRQMQAPLEEGVKRSYTFYASEDDTHISPYYASFPRIDGARYETVRKGVSHIHMIPHLHKKVTQEALLWMKAQGEEESSLKASASLTGEAKA